MIRFTVFDCPKEDALGIYPRHAHRPAKTANSSVEKRDDYNHPLRERRIDYCYRQRGNCREVPATTLPEDI